MNRRHFLMGSLAAAGAASRSRARAGANDTVRVACVGVRSRGAAHIQRYLKIPGVELAALCDVDESVLDRRLAEVAKTTGRKPERYTDIRKLLENKSIDAISIATPNHWHTLMTIWGCQAGKDVYVEKPCSHNIFEARQIVAAARKYNRIVQHGTQSRSTAAIQEAVHRVKEGVIGDLYMARGLCFKWRDTIGHTPVSAVPAGVHYDLWLGPAPLHEFTRNRFHYNWHWFWDYGNGDLGNQGVHQVDIGRWMIGGKYPTRVSAMGGHFMFDDDQQTPNTLNAAFEFHINGKPRLFVFEVRHWISNHEAGIGEPKPGAAAHVDVSGRRVAGRDQNTIGDIFYGDKGYLALGNGYRTYLGKEQQPGPSSAAPGEDHFENFIRAVRSRNRSELNAEVEEGAASTVLVHLANISYRVGRTVHFDAETMTCKGDAEANRLLTREYRAPFVVPEKV